MSNAIAFPDVVRRAIVIRYNPNGYMGSYLVGAVSRDGQTVFVADRPASVKANTGDDAVVVALTYYDAAQLPIVVHPKVASYHGARILAGLRAGYRLTVGPMPFSTWEGGLKSVEPVRAAADHRRVGGAA